jgi:low temperature requirement protein LtrA
VGYQLAGSGRLPVRLLLIALALVALVMSAALPTAFGRWGLLVGGAYAVMQIGRSLFMVIVLRASRCWRTSSGSWPGVWSAACWRWLAGS